MERSGSVPRGFENPYLGFLWKELSIIRELERAREYYEALHFSVSLLKYLQPEVRKKQEKQAKAIFTKIRQTVVNTRGTDFFTTEIMRNRVAKRLGQEYLEQIITALSDQLGQRAYMEGRGISPRTKGGGRLKSE